MKNKESPPTRHEESVKESNRLSKWTKKYRIIWALLLGFLGGALVGIPDPQDDDLPQSQILHAETRLCSYAYDGRTKGPVWVMQSIRPGDTRGKIPHLDVVKSPNVPLGLQFDPAEIQKAGFDLGQLLTIEPWDLTQPGIPLWTLSPQVPQFNLGYWAKFDNYVRERVQKLNQKRVYVLTGPLFLSRKEANGKKYVSYEVIGEKEVAVPTHFFRALFYFADDPKTDAISSEIYIIPNEDVDLSIPIESFKTSLQDLENKSGIQIPSHIRDYLNDSSPTRLL